MRRLTTHKGISVDGEKLQIVTCYEEDVCKQQIKKENPYSKQYDLLINRGSFYEFVQKRA